MFNMKKVELELISDVDIYLSFEKSMREGVYYNSKSIVKPAISIWNLMIQSKNQNILYT